MKLRKVSKVKRVRSTNQQYPSCFRLEPPSQFNGLGSYETGRYVNGVSRMKTSCGYISRTAYLNNWHSGKNLGRCVPANYDNIDLSFGILRTKFSDLMLFVFR